MAFNVTIRQSGKQFQVEADEPVLNAALRQGIGCRTAARTAHAARARDWS
jgi:hypothetical protein